MSKIILEICKCLGIKTMGDLNDFNNREKSRGSNLMERLINYKKEYDSYDCN